MRSSLQKEIVTAARMRARGATYREIADHFGRSVESIRTWRNRHRAMWNAAYDAVLAKAVDEVAAMAGTSAVLAMPAEFAATAEQADAWLRETTDEGLFPDPPADAVKGGELTVGAFFETFMRPNCLAEASQNTVHLYRVVIKKFALTMGNPSLREIDAPLLARYRDILKGSHGRGTGKPLSVNTCRMYLRNLQHVLDRAGPPGPRRRDAAGYLRAVPWIRLPRMELREPRVVADDVLAKCYAETWRMQTPRIKGVDPAKWWRALLVTGRYLGLRARTMFGLEFAHVEARAKRLNLPASILKSRKALMLPLPPVVLEHIEAIRTARQFVFQLSTSREYFRREFHRLQSSAGVLPQQWFGLHTLRRTAITRLWAKHPSAAQLLAGHGSPLITKLHYVASGDVLVDALNDETVGSFAGAT